MKIILNCGDKINIPDGCKAEIKDGVITIEKEEPKFKDGDIVVSIEKANNICPFIYKKEADKGTYEYYAAITMYKDLIISYGFDYWKTAASRLATEEEKQLLFDKLAEQGLRWNAEEKRVEKIRWRAEKGSLYYLFTTAFYVARAEEDGKEVANHRYAAYNYFRTKEQAEKAAELIKETLKKFHEENS